jgi:biopolymer transport protein ExbD
MKRSEVSTGASGNRQVPAKPGRQGEGPPLPRGERREANVAAKETGETELKIQMTPLIDVTFLILIFLMILPFKTLERKVAAFLPKDRGQAPTDIRLTDPPKITVALRPSSDRGESRLKLLDSPLGSGEGAFLALDDGIAAIHARSPELGGEINADGEVPHADVVRTVDAFLKAGVTDIQFQGARMPGPR